ncbi:MAG: tetratricopeptide repeat protein, partial [Planctomycetota bacterium]
MKRTAIYALLFVAVATYSLWQYRAVAEGEHAPPHAFVDGSTHPYYGSLNQWDLRFFSEHLHLYGRRGQRQMLDILEGRVDDAAKYCRELLASNPKDAESLFTLTVARCAQKDYVAAAETMKKAVEAGLPFERFLAGPRGMLKPLRQTEQFQKLIKQCKPQLIHGPMLGCVTDTSAGFWVRTFEEVPVQVLVSSSKNLSDPIESTTVSTSSRTDYTAIVEVKGLEPDTVYYYDV